MRISKFTARVPDETHQSGDGWAFRFRRQPFWAPDGGSAKAERAAEVPEKGDFRRRPVMPENLTNLHHPGIFDLCDERTREGKSKARPPGPLRRPGGFLLIWNRPQAVLRSIARPLRSKPKPALRLHPKTF